MRNSTLKKTVMVSCLTLVATGLGAATTTATAQPLTKAPDVQVEPSIGGKEFVPGRQAGPDRAMRSSKSYQVHADLPAPTQGRRVELPSTRDEVAPIAGTPVAVGKATTPAAKAPAVPGPDSAAVEVLPQSAARSAGVHGFVFRLSVEATSPASGAEAGDASTGPSSAPTGAPAPDAASAQAEPTTGPVEVPVQVDYSGFADAFGGDYASRLRLVMIPECAIDANSRGDCPAPMPLPTTRDANSKTLRATAPVRLNTGQTATTQTSSTLLAVTSTSGGDEGDFGATSLAPASEWSVGTQTGNFSWSYPIPTVPVPGGLAPDLSLSYSSQSIDGRTQASNNQTSWLGEGQSLEPGFIERSYAACADSQPDGEKTGDLCWKSANQNATMSFQGQSTQLVKDQSTGLWRAKDDQGWRIRKLSGDPNGDNNGEYWELTDQDGTRYYFGREKRFDTDTADTNSAWTVPVYGDDAGEPCHDSTFAGSRCKQVWRWNLDYVVDVHNNTISYFYNEETNHYGANLNTAQPMYVRGGYLTRIDYGQVAGLENSVTPAARVLFTTAERCIPDADFDCDPSKLTDANASHWPDVPFDQICESDTDCPDQFSPTFFSRKRLVGITTQVLKNGALTNADRFDLTQSFPVAGDGSGRSLYLNSIQRTGLNGGTASTPPVTFAAALMENRVMTGNTAPLNKWRVTGITTETGATITIGYSAKDCAPGDVPAEESTNTRRCFPVYWSLWGGDPTVNWFHKYVVDSVVEGDHAGTVTPVPTYYTYSGGGAWHYDNNELVKKKYRTWGQWRGYSTVEVRQGDASEPDTVQSYDKYLYLRGMDGDHLPDGGSRSVTVTDSQGGTTTDLDRYNGFLREHIQKSGTTIVSAEINDPWSTGVTADDGTDRAYIVRNRATHVRKQLVGTGNYVRSATSTDYDGYGLPTVVHDDGNDSISNDSTCTRTTYARNTTAWILTPVSNVQTVKVACSVTPGSGDVLAAKRYSFDNQAYGAAPTKGDVTAEETLHGTGAGTWTVTKRSVYDARGRAVSTIDALGNTSSVAYTPAGTSTSTLGPVTKTTTTNALGQTTSTTLDPARGSALSYTDLNGRITSATYDPLGRRTAVWRPGHTQGTDSADLKFSYSVSASTYSYVKTDRLLLDGSYTPAYTILDARLRTAETQAESAGTTTGRVITTSYFNSRGQKIQDAGPFTVNYSAPSGTYYAPDTVQITNNHRYLYDGAGRQTTEIYQPKNNESAGWRTTTSYDADRVSVDPPTGGTPSVTVTDVRGDTIERIQYLADGLSGPTRATDYGYDLAGRMTSMTDPAGNQWTWDYDLAGNQTSAGDPDSGTTTTTYDAANQPVTVTDPTGSTHTSYDKLGRKTALYEGTSADPAKLRAAWTYDQAPDGSPVTNGIGELTSATRYAGDGGATAPAYVQQITGYEVHGQPTGATTTIPSIPGETTGASGNPSDTVAGTYTTSMTYLADGSPSTTTLPAAPGLAAETLHYGYDRLGQPNGMGGIQSLVGAAKYSPYGELLQTTTGTTSGKLAFNTWFYDEGTRRLTRSIVSDQAVAGSITDANYSYDPAGNVRGIADNASTNAGAGKDLQCFTYDYQRQLTDAWTIPTGGTCGTPSQAAMASTAGTYWSAYSYDAIGNRTTQTSYPKTGTPTVTTYTYPASGNGSTLDGTTGGPHALSGVVSKVGTTTTTSTAYEYDTAGQMRTRGDQTLTWDPEGKLETTTSTPGVEAAKNVYDADGIRLLRKDPDGTITLYLDGTEIRLQSGTQTSQRWYDFAGLTVATRTSSGLQLLSVDPHGTGQAQISAANAAYTKRRFDPFGNLRTPTSVPTGTTWAGGHGYLEKPVDQTGLTQVGARYYDTTIGKFISTDPILDTSNPIQANAYAYAENNPVTMSDPTGLAAKCVLEGTCESKPNPAGGPPIPTGGVDPEPQSSGPTGVGRPPAGHSGASGQSSSDSGAPESAPEQVESNFFVSLFTPITLGFSTGYYQAAADWNAIQLRKMAFMLRRSEMVPRSLAGILHLNPTKLDADAILKSGSKLTAASRTLGVVGTVASFAEYRKKDSTTAAVLKAGIETAAAYGTGAVAGAGCGAVSFGAAAPLCAAAGGVAGAHAGKFVNRVLSSQINTAADSIDGGLRWTGSKLNTAGDTLGSVGSAIGGWFD